MKILLSAFLLLCNAALLSQTIPNGDMEEWETVGGWYEIPSYWSTLDNQVITHTEKDSAACEGNFALKVKPLLGIETTMGTARIEFLEEFVPAQLSFCVKTNIESDEFFTDTCRVVISFWNTGVFVYSEEWTNTESINEWTYQTIELNQIEPIITSCSIEVQASYPGIGLGSGSTDTWISVDDFSFDEVDSISESKEGETTVYPNPSQNGEFSIKSNSKIGQIQVFDLIGNLIYNNFENSNSIQLNLNLPSGIYLIKTNHRTQKIVVQ